MKMKKAYVEYDYYNLCEMMVDNDATIGKRFMGANSRLATRF